ncbi:hypothetical protein ECZU34_58710 [Escherichia coli]|nr:hypothetical protein ECZU34_58710 [Escherichia coli]
MLGEACRQMHKWQDRHGNRSVLPSMCPPAVGPTFDDEVKRVLADMPAELWRSN